MPYRKNGIPTFEEIIKRHQHFRLVLQEIRSWLGGQYNVNIVRLKNELAIELASKLDEIDPVRDAGL